MVKPLLRVGYSLPLFGESSLSLLKSIFGRGIEAAPEKANLLLKIIKIRLPTKNH